MTRQRGYILKGNAAFVSALEKNSRAFRTDLPFGDTLLSALGEDRFERLLETLLTIRRKP
jgi:hypothetical protein